MTEEACQETVDSAEETDNTQSVVSPLFQQWTANSEALIRRESWMFSRASLGSGTLLWVFLLSGMTQWPDQLSWDLARLFGLAEFLEPATSSQVFYTVKAD